MQPPLTTDTGTASPRFRVGDLDVDIGKAEVTRADEKIALPKLSFDLLCALIDAAPAIVTNDELLERVWPGLQVSPESVAQRVKLLRSALGDDSQQPRYILGVRGRGYRLIPVPERLAESYRPAAAAANPSTNTPTVIVPSGLMSRAGPSRHWSRQKTLVIAAAVVIGLGAVIALALHFSAANRGGAETSAAMTIHDKFIAVLPFVDMSEKKDQEYFADGMAEEIIDLLVKIPGLKVIGRTSSFQFKGQSQDLRSIGEKLGVAYLLEGSVRKSGDRLRVTAQLINSGDGTHLWSQTYDRDLSNVLTMQDEIAIKVATALQTEVFIREHFVSRPALRNAEAYTLFLQGVHADMFQGEQGWEQGLSEFQRALDLDPTFTEAAVRLAGLYQYGGQLGYVPKDVAFRKTQDFAKLALKLDPNFAVAHALLGSIYDTYAWDWPAAEAEIKLAEAIAPSVPTVLLVSERHSLILGNWDDALKLVNAQQAVDPLNPDGYYHLSIVQLRRDRPAEAEAAIRRALELSPRYASGQYTLGLVLLARKQPEAALAEMNKEPFEPVRLIGSALANFALGNRANSDAALALLLKGYAANIPAGVAAVYAYRGESDEAFKWLDLAYEQKDALLHRLKLEPEFDKLHGDPRYKAFLRKMNLPE
ncbi:MAG TPA: winged helix-turn-helix domain-containing protein [Steroidobacteraceae bacterium]|nr:winged helix-turn-helix domain-containing protein [Steroidobacteraceae bacterium]